ncbi:MAG: aminotransferase class V-fold PLP-dependent enzyme [Acidimicrobiia bacterium]|nr:aminotransferase class V-fold PLP-dependent enzyme [Acidimicrobiia bacterium]
MRSMRSGYLFMVTKPGPAGAGLQTFPRRNSITIVMLSQLFKRRDLFRAGALLAPFAGFRSTGNAAQLRLAGDIYASIGVRPIINCKGTFTIISGSQSLPEVKRAMDLASRHYIHLDELMEKVGQRLAQITKAEWGIVTAGCAAALSHATAACIAGADPEKLQRLPDLTGMKNEVIAPRYSRNVYDHAVRQVGPRIVEVNSIQEYERAFNDRTAMVMVLAGSGDKGPLGLEALCPIAKQKGVPVLVDAAAERLTIPNGHLARGATMVAYSGGKCLRGPQCAGILLGPKNLLQAAWLHSAPHHAYGRPMKVGKEEIMGMLAAVEAWVKRDHDAEWKQWESWLDHIARKVKTIPGVTTEILQPEGLSNNSPRLRIKWEKLSVTGREAEERLLEGEPRVIVGGSTGDRTWGGADSLTIMPYMMMPGDEKIAADRIHTVLTGHGPHIRAYVGPTAHVAGQWDVDIQYGLGSSRHNLVLEQKEGQLLGTHSGEYLSSDLRGLIRENEIIFRSSHRYEGTRIGYEFSGVVKDDSITGTVHLGEYGQARFTARRHNYGQPGGVVRPVKNV